MVATYSHEQLLLERKPQNVAYQRKFALRVKYYLRTKCKPLIIRII